MSIENQTNNKKIIIVLVVVVAIISVLFVPFIPTSEAYVVTEPYSRQCTYVVDNWDLEEKFGFFDVYVQSDVSVRNNDVLGGTFEVVHTLEDINGVVGRQSDSFYLGAGQSYTSSITFDTTWGQDTKGKYSVSAPTITDEQIVTKEKTVYRSIVDIALNG